MTSLRTMFALGCVVVSLSCGGQGARQQADGGGESEDVSDSGTAGPKTVFITRAELTGALGGLAGADTHCANAASAAGRSGRWRAYVASETASAGSRIADVGPWHQRFADGHTALTFASKAAFLTGPAVALTVDEAGLDLGSVETWTGTLADGTFDYGSTCLDFTTAGAIFGADVGAPSHLDATWHSAGAITCDHTRHLICFEQ
jgi:hypothetical protein